MAELDSWGSARSEVAGVDFINLACTVLQQQSERSPSDHGSTMQSCWVLGTIPQIHTFTIGDTTGYEVFLAVDIGYRDVPEVVNESQMVHCLAVREIGDHVGSFDLSLSPIGPYSLCQFLSSVHCTSEDVRIYMEI